VEFTLDGAPRAGDRFIVETSQSQGVLDTVGRLAEGLRSLPATGDQDEAYQQLIGDTLNNLDAAMNNIVGVRSEIGARMNVMDSVRGLHDQVTQLSTELKSEIEDVDIAKAISDLSHQTLILEAAQQTFARVSRLSLFNAI
jgi:flagellar hook-associated protein 3 FlgL